MTYRTISRAGNCSPIVALAVLTALMLQVIFEFGPLWLVASGARPVVRAVLGRPVSTLGLGGLLAGRVRLDRPATLTVAIAVLTLASWVLTMSRNILVVIRRPDRRCARGRSP